MLVVHLVSVIAGVTSKVACFPASDFVFPEQSNVVEAAHSGEDRFRQDNYLNQSNYPSNQWTNSFRPQSSRPRGAYRPLSSRPNGNSRLIIPHQPVQGSRPSFLRPDDFIPPGTRPSGVFNPQGSAPKYSRPLVPRPSENFRPEGSKTFFNPSSLQPDFPAMSSSGNIGSSNQNSGSIGISSSDSVGFPIPDPQTSSTEGLEVSTVQSTTKIPRRDPTYRIISTSPCPCMFTRQYSPVCGTDGQTYLNIAILQCVQTCGRDVKVFLEGSCGRNNGHAGAIDLHYR